VVDSKKSSETRMSPVIPLIETPDTALGKVKAAGLVGVIPAREGEVVRVMVLVFPTASLEQYSMLVEAL
jgi:hypothetical protein